jgi:hypothetical protein
MYANLDEKKKQVYTDNYNKEKAKYTTKLAEYEK